MHEFDEHTTDGKSVDLFGGLISKADSSDAAVQPPQVVGSTRDGDLVDVVRDGDDFRPEGQPWFRSIDEGLSEPMLAGEFVPKGDAGPADERLAAMARKMSQRPAGRRAFATSQPSHARLNLSEADVASLAGGGIIVITAPLDAVTWSSVGLGRADRVAPALVEQRAHEIEIMGQLKPNRARLLTDGSIEILTGMVEWLAAKYLAEQTGTVGTVRVALEQLDDEAAHKVVHADAAEGVAVTPIDLARWAMAAIATTFKTQRALAAALGIDESNVTRLLQVSETVDALRDVITDEWAVSRAQAARFMQLWGDKELRPATKRFVKELAPASAAKTFRAIFERFADAPAKRGDEVDVAGDGDRLLGRIRATKAGEVVIKLNREAGAVELPALVGFVESALAQLRASVA